MAWDIRNVNLIFRDGETLYRDLSNASIWDDFSVWCYVGPNIKANKDYFGAVYQRQRLVYDPAQFLNDQKNAVEGPFVKKKLILIQFSDGRFNKYLPDMTCNFSEKEKDRLWESVYDFRFNPEECLRKWHPFYRTAAPTTGAVDPETWRAAGRATLMGVSVLTPSASTAPKEKKETPSHRGDPAHVNRINYELVSPANCLGSIDI